MAGNYNICDKVEIPLSYTEANRAVRKVGDKKQIYLKSYLR